jgi:hypothetical protein
MVGERRSGSRREEYLRWLIAMVLAAAVSYFTTQARIDRELGSITATQSAQFNEVLRRLDLMQTDIRELRQRP